MSPVNECCNCTVISHTTWHSEVSNDVTCQWMLLLYCHFTYYMTVKCQMMSPVNECYYCTVISHTTWQWSVKWCHLSMNVAIVLSFHILQGSEVSNDVTCQWMLLLYCHFTYYMTQWSVKWCHLSMNVAIVLLFHILHDTVKCQMMSPVNKCCYCTVISHTTWQWSVKWCHLSMNVAIVLSFHILQGSEVSNDVTCQWMLLLYCYFTYYKTVKCQMMSPVNECYYCTVISHTTWQWSVKWCHLSMNVAIVLLFHILQDSEVSNDVTCLACSTTASCEDDM